MIMDTLDNASNYTNTAYDKISSAANYATEALAEKGKDALYLEQQLVRNARHTIRNKPITWLGVTASAGFLLSYLLNSHKSAIPAKPGSVKTKSWIDGLLVKRIHPRQK